MNFFEKENDISNIEYKLYINPKKKTRILSQFYYRMHEGGGKAIYLIGVHDLGHLYVKDISILLKSINRFINIIKEHAKYKVKIFTNKPYIYSIISLYNSDIPESNNIIDFNQF
tara:strand:- start:34 stop:375 length:342 start_codon:yes stop_codon:yes gene_type:complete